MRIARPHKGEPIRLLSDHNGKASLDRAGRPRYRAVIDVGTTASGRRRQMTSTHTSLTEARDWVTRTRASVKSGTFIAPERVSFDQLADEWLASKAGVRPVTKQGYVDVLKAVRDHLGSKRVQTITRADVDTMMAALAVSGRRGHPLSKRSLGYTLTTAKAVFRFGIPRLLTVNPAEGVEIPHGAAPRGDVTPWEPAELLRFRAIADEHEWAGAWRVALSGLRRSEVLGLTWDAVDFDAGTVTVKAGRVRLDGGSTATDEPKAARSKRTVPVELLHPGSMALLRSMRARQASDRLAAGSAYQDNSNVIVDALGVPVPPERFTREFCRLSREAGVAVVKLHWLRHTLATIMHRAGVEAADAAAVLGHSTAVHLTYYVTSTPAGVSRAAQAFASTLKEAN